MITFLCYLALGIFIFIPVWSSFFGTPIIKKKEPGFYQEKNHMFDFGFAVFSHRCRFELRSVYLMHLRRFTTSHAKLPFDTNTQTDIYVIPF